MLLEKLTDLDLTLLRDLVERVAVQRPIEDQVTKQSVEWVKSLNQLQK